MRYSTRALLTCVALATAPAAWAEPTWTLNKVIITGNTTLSTDQLMAVVQEKPGYKITVGDITADRDAITKALEDAHSSATSVSPTMQAVGQRVNITFAIVNDRGAQAPVVTKVAPKLHEEIFDGNKLVSSDTLAAAAGLKPGQDLSNDTVLAAENAIKAAYAAAKLPAGVGVGITGENKKLSDGSYDVIWHITETKAKKKKNTEDEGFKSE